MRDIKRGAPVASSETRRQTAFLVAVASIGIVTLVALSGIASADPVSDRVVVEMTETTEAVPQEWNDDAVPEGYNDSKWPTDVPSAGTQPQAEEQSQPEATPGASVAAAEEGDMMTRVTLTGYGSYTVPIEWVRVDSLSTPERIVYQWKDEVNRLGVDMISVSVGNHQYQLRDGAIPSEFIEEKIRLFDGIKAPTDMVTAEQMTTAQGLPYVAVYHIKESGMDSQYYVVRDGQYFLVETYGTSNTVDLSETTHWILSSFRWA